MRKQLVWLFLGALLIVWNPLFGASQAKEIPVETLFQTPAMSGLEFSPDGKKILALMPFMGRQNLAVIDLEKGTKNLISSFTDKDAIQPF